MFQVCCNVVKLSTTHYDKDDSKNIQAVVSYLW